MILGAVVYLTAPHFDTGPERYRIDAGPAQRARIEATFQQQYGAPPTRAQLDYLLEQYVRSEILFREGLSLGLDRDDEIVRRRVVQKIEFLNEDTQTIESVDDAKLAQFLSAHASRYAAPAAASFKQVYFSVDRGGDKAARTRAEFALKQIGRTNADVKGDVFTTGNEFSSVNATEAVSLFGDSQLSAALFTAPVGQWAGPFRSGYGWHLVYVSARELARPQALDVVRDRVQADYLAEARTRANDAEFRRIASKYQIVTEPSS
jgi:hypothetical protein